jgi:hypothetical protein
MINNSSLSINTSSTSTFKRIFLVSILFIFFINNNFAQSTLDWSSAPWTDGQTSGTIPLTVPAGFDPQTVTINVSLNAADGAFVNDSGGNGVFPKIDYAASGIFGGIDDFAIAIDPEDTGRTNTDSPVTITLTFSTPVNNLNFFVSDIDYSNPRVDAITVTSNAGDPVSITRVVTTNSTVANIGANSFSSSTSNGDSSNDNLGSVEVDFGSKLVTTITVVYSDSNNSGGARGVGFFGTFFVVTNSTMDAVNDIGIDVTEGLGGETVANVLSNDTFQTGNPTTSDVTLTQESTTNAGVTLNTSTGAVNVASTVPPGDYTLVYQICETALLSNCKTASVTVTVLPDNDGDGISDADDLDDDNDGILDTVENACNDGSSASRAFTSLGQARSVSSAGTYFFKIAGQQFSTYVDANGYIQIAIDFGNGSGNLPQSNTLTNATRGILSTDALATLTTATSVRISHSGGNLDILSTNATLLNRVTTNTTLHQGTLDNTINDTWTGTNSTAITVDATCTSSRGTSLHQNIAHLCGNTSGFHWIPNTGVQRIRHSSGSFTGEIGNTESFTLWVQVPVASCTAVDTDEDGVPDYLDLDSDNDGIPDVIEAGGTDTNRDGLADGIQSTQGIPLSAGIGLSLQNTDGDALPNHLDIDADNDGIPDNIEAQTSLGYQEPSGISTDMADENNNGVDDFYEDLLNNIVGLDPTNTDGTDNPDYLDLDSDNDTILDIQENGDTDNVLSGDDSDGDGLYDIFDDNNDSSITGYTVNDGLGLGDKVTNPTNLEIAYGDIDSDFNPGAGELDYRDFPDNDNDGIIDSIDIDDDNDGILDTEEVGGFDPSADHDGDLSPNYKDIHFDTGVVGDSLNSFGVWTSLDSDNDGIPNHFDLDSDNDSIPDNIEAQSTTSYVPPTDIDSDNDGLDDAYDTTPNGNIDGSGSLGITPQNTDSADNPDYLDLDSDNDGVFDIVESSDTPLVHSEGKVTGVVGTNGLIDSLDNGDDFTDVNGSFDNTQTDNFTDTDSDINLSGGDVDYRDISELDTDGDTIPDEDDFDDDNDGILDTLESTGNLPDGDEDGDGIPNYKDTSDLTPSDGNTGTDYTDENGDGTPDVYDKDGDGVPNHLDLDSDNDGITDVIESGGIDTDKDGRADGAIGTDGTSKGVPNSTTGGTGNTPIATADGDTVPDYLDIDADNDGIPDNIEGQSSAGYKAPSGGGSSINGITDDNKNGVDDNYENDVIIGIDPVNTDNTDSPDYIDTDADNDGINDISENGDTNNVLAGTDADNDGLDDNFDDNDDSTIQGATVNDGVGINANDGIGVGDKITDTISLDDAFGDQDNDFPGTGDLDYRDFLDSDNDGVADDIDLDDDNDGILDLIESNGNNPEGDADGDGILNYKDTDITAGGTGDGSITDYVDLNTDGIPDIYDNDGDGIPNHLDLDSDNDGIPDVIEAGGTDSNKDGLADDDDDNENNTDSNGIPTSAGVGITTPTNSDSADGDTLPDYLDIDSDNDGIPDNIEGQSTSGYVAPSGVGSAMVDDNNHGLDDNYENDAILGIAPENTDDDVNPDYIDTNSDNDGVLDIAENGVPANNVLSGGDSDGDGLYDIFDDNDDSSIQGATVNDGINPPNASNLGDTDLDLYIGGDVDYRDIPGDTDGDGISDDVDLDDDNDGIIDVIENGNCSISDKEEIFILYSQDFGTGLTRDEDDNVQNHTPDNSGAIPDGSYAVVSSLNSGLAQYNRTDQNSDLDANIDQFSGPVGGSSDGRYLSINMINTDNIEFYRQPLTDLIIGADYRYRLDLAGLCNACDDLPIFRLEVQDTSGTVLQSVSSASLGVLNDDIWKRVVLNFTATTNQVNIVIINNQPNGAAGNDVGVDNIVFGLLQCSSADNDFDNDGIINSLDLDSDNDGCPDALEGDGGFSYTDLDANNRINNPVNANGIPINPGTIGGNTGQADVSSVNDVVQSTECDPCNPASSTFLDTDLDGIGNECDLDDDNDGILDTVECGSINVALNKTATAQSNEGTSFLPVEGVDGITTTDNYWGGNTNPIWWQVDLGENFNIGSIRVIHYFGDSRYYQYYIETSLDGINWAQVAIKSNNNLSTSEGVTFPISNILSRYLRVTTTLNSANSSAHIVEFEAFTSCSDTDGDGIINSLDLDSDNDGIPDVIESGGIDTDRDGIADGTVGVTTDTNGIPSSTTDGTGNTPTATVDGDTIPDYLDIDADNDGIPDNIEGQPTAGYIAPSGTGANIIDENKNGIDDNYENGEFVGLDPENTDGIDTPDYIDPDSDEDGTPDIQENGTRPDSLTSTDDSDGDGLFDIFEGTDINDGFDVNDEIDIPNKASLGDIDDDATTIGDVDYRDTAVNGVPMITQVYHLDTEKWIEITNIGTSSIPANLIKIQLFKDKTGDQTDVTPDVNYTVTTILPAGKSVLFKNTANSIAIVDNPLGTTDVVTNDLLTDIDGADDIITLSKTADGTSWSNRYDVISSFADNTSYVRIDETLLPNTTFTESEWVLFVDDSLDPYRLLGAGGAERHPHDPLISEIESSNTNANTLLGLHRIDITIRKTGAWDNGYPDRSRFVEIDDDYNHNPLSPAVNPVRLSARKLRVNADKKLSVTDNLLVVTNNIFLNGDIRLVDSSPTTDPALRNSAAQLIQTHKDASLVTGTTGKLLVDQNSTVPSLYRYNYIGSPVKNSVDSATYTVADILKDGTVPTNHDDDVNTDIAKDINWIGGYDGNFTNSPTNPISLANYWIYTYASNGGTRSSWAQKFSGGTIPNADGFIFKGPGRVQNYTYLGIPKDGDVTTFVGRNESYLLANPYASALSVKEFIEDNVNSISGTLYFWEHAGEETVDEGSTGHNFAGYIGGYATVNLIGGVSARGAATDSVDINLEAEEANEINGTLEQVLDNGSNINVVEFSSTSNFIKFENISSGVDNLRIRYKSTIDKSIIIKVEGEYVQNYNFTLPQTAGEFSVLEIVRCVEAYDDISIISDDANQVYIDYLNLYDEDGQIECAPSLGGNDIEYTEPKKYISIGQGFFIQGDDTNGGTIVFNNSQREYITEGTESVFLKSSAKKSETNNNISNIPVIKLGMNFNGSDDAEKQHRQIAVGFSQYTSFEYDNGYDSEIYDIGSTDFYWKFPSDTRKFVIAGVQTISDNLQVPIEITIGYSGNVTIKVDEMKNVTNNVYITDKITGKSYDIINGKAILTLDQGVYTDRFVLAFSPNNALSIDETIENAFTNLYIDNNNHQLIISKNLEIEINKIELYNILGKKVGLWNIEEQKSTYQLKIKEQLPMGIYIVKMNTNKGETNKKIVIE